MRVTGWMTRSKFGNFLLCLPIYIGGLLAIMYVYHLLSGKKIDWFFTLTWGLFVAAVNAWVPATKWRPRLNRWE